jgi:hypothetical protein
VVEGTQTGSSAVEEVVQLMQQLSLWEKGQLAKESIQRRKKKTSLASLL